VVTLTGIRAVCVCIVTPGAMPYALTLATARSFPLRESDCLAKNIHKSFNVTEGVHIMTRACQHHRSGCGCIKAWEGKGLCCNPLPSKKVLLSFRFYEIDKNKISNK
jgi:hypothetical protein